MRFSQEAIAEFKASWDDAQSDSFGDRMARKSLLSLAYDVPEFQAVLDSETREKHNFTK